MDRKPNLSFVVVPMIGGILAVVMVVFGVAYFLQNRSEYEVEVADFDFETEDGEEEPRTFAERLREEWKANWRRGSADLEHILPGVSGTR